MRIEVIAESTVSTAHEFSGAPSERCKAIRTDLMGYHKALAGDGIEI